MQESAEKKTVNDPKKAGGIFYEGYIFPPMVPGNVKDHMDGIKEMEIRPDDIFVVTYPRSGTHWTVELLRMMVDGKAEYHNNDEALCIEFNPLASYESMESPRVLLTHLPYKFLPRNVSKCRVIYVSRNPKDVAVSIHCIMKTVQMADNTGWTTFLQNFLEGKVAFGTWFEHVKQSSLLAKTCDRFKTLKYEDMKKDLKGCLQELSEFLNISIEETVLDGIVSACAFKSLKDYKDKNMSEKAKEVGKNSTSGDNFFYRKGVVGDWKNWFTVAQNEMFDHAYAEQMKNSQMQYDFT